jgi:RecB family exonuclease
LSTDTAATTADPSAAWDKGCFHVSQIRTYLTCPRQYLFRHKLGMKSEEVGFSALVGSAIHNVISSWHLRQREPAIERLMEEFAQDLERRRDAVWNAGKEIGGYDGVASMEKAIKEAGQMMGGYVEDRRNHVPLVANETRFRVKVQGGKTPYPFAGTIDQARRESEGHLHLADIKTGKTKPQQILLDLDMQLSLYAIALAKGEVERVGDTKVEWGPVNERPAMLSIIHLRDYMPYEKNEFAEFTTHPTETEINPETKRKRKKKIPNPRFAEGYKKGEQRGPVFYTTQRSAFDLEQAEKDLSRICAAIKFNMFFRRPAAQGACIGFCRFVAECTADRSAPI